MVKRNGLAHVAFFTATFAENLTDRVEAQRRWNSFATNFLRRHTLEHIAAVERQARGAIHYHVVLAFAYDVRSGFDFVVCSAANSARKLGDQGVFRTLQRQAFSTANDSLRRWWSMVRAAAPDFGFGRCETLPILSNSEALCRYVGSYVATELDNRQLRDKGLRTIRYSIKRVPMIFEGKETTVSLRPASIRWTWVNGNGVIWRKGCAALAVLLGVEDLSAALGSRWAWAWREAIPAFGRNYETFCRAVNSDNFIWDSFEQRVARASKLAEVIIDYENKLANKSS